VTRALLVLAAALVLVAGCGDGDDSGAETTTGGEETTEATVYFLREDQVWPVRRETAEPGTNAALDELNGGPSGDEESDLELTTAIPEEGVSASIAGGVATVESAANLSDQALAQVVYTLTSDPAVTSVEVGGQAYTRDDFEEFTPPVLVESPLAYDTVSSPLNARGTANTFEATFSFEIKDSEGEVIASDFATATSGSGMRGTFSFAQPFVVEGAEAGSLVVFELSAEDGSRTNEVEIPLELQG
jgi:immunoglobulin-like protein involved in spore germination/sporulation and spore germination protein